MRAIQTSQGGLFTIMECHFQRSISQAMNMAVIVHIMVNSGESEYESSCAYYYLFLFSGWWFNCSTDVSLNGKYNPPPKSNGFRWLSPAIGIILPIRSEMKIRRK